MRKRSIPKKHPTCDRCKARPTRNGLWGYCRECQRDYSRERRRAAGVAPIEHAARRFWRYVTGTDRDGCWAWVGLLNGNGYGEFGRLGLAHRFSWTICNGPIPAGMWVLHRCDNRVCVRPDHLFLGDRRTNTDDMVHKGRQAMRARNAASKLSAPQVLEIRRLRAKGVPARELARRFGCDDMNIFYICTRVTWRSI